MFNFLATTRIRAVIDELVDIRQYSTQFPWLQRVGIIDAMDGEIFARFKGRIYAADIITLDGKATIRSAPSIRLTQTEIPVLKHGMGFTREMLRLIMRIEANMASTAERGIFANYVAANLGYLIQGVYTRMEALTIGMLVDGYSYNRLGIQMSGVTWGMPSDLKVTLTSTAKWDAPTTADPIADLLNLKTLGQQKYGINFNRVTMSTTAFLNATATTKFQQRAQGLFQVNQAYIFPLQSVEMMIPIFGRVLGMEVEIDDRQFWTEADDGSEGTTRFQAVNQVILSATMFDGTRDAYDFANAECEEAMPGMVPSIIGGFEGTEGGAYGPIGYATAASPDANPPGLNLWAVGSGFPRKHKEAATAVLTAF